MSKIDPNKPAMPCIPTDRSGQIYPMCYGMSIRTEIAALNKEPT